MWQNQEIFYHNGIMNSDSDPSCHHGLLQYELELSKAPLIIIIVQTYLNTLRYELSTIV